MPDGFGFSEGIKGVSGALDSTREASKSLTKSIEGIQNDGADVARQKLAERRKAQQVKPDETIMRAYKEYQILEEVKKLELRIKAEVVNKHGQKAWDDIQAIKMRMIKEDKQNKVYFESDLKKVRRVQVWCFIAALIVTLWLKFILGAF